MRISIRLPAKRMPIHLKLEHAGGGNKKEQPREGDRFACGEEFVIGHDPQLADKRAAEKQAKWLEKVLADEHERDRKHPDRIELPD